MDKCERYNSMDGCVHVDEAIVRARKEGRAEVLSDLKELVGELEGTKGHDKDSRMLIAMLRDKLKGIINKTEEGKG